MVKIKKKDLIKKFNFLDDEDEISFVLEKKIFKSSFINFAELEFKHFNLREKEIQIVLVVK